MHTKAGIFHHLFRSYLAHMHRKFYIFIFLYFISIIFKAAYLLNHQLQIQLDVPHSSRLNGSSFNNSNKTHYKTWSIPPYHPLYLDGACVHCKWDSLGFVPIVTLPNGLFQQLLHMCVYPRYSPGFMPIVRDF